MNRIVLGLHTLEAKLPVCAFPSRSLGTRAMFGNEGKIQSDAFAASQAFNTRIMLPDMIL